MAKVIVVQEGDAYFVEVAVSDSIAFVVQNNIRDICGNRVCDFIHENKIISFLSSENIFHGNSLKNIIEESVERAEKQFWSFTRLKRQVREAFNKCKDTEKILQIARIVGV